VGGGFCAVALIFAIEQMVVEDLLIPLGYVVTCAMDGVEGLEILASRDYLPDLILLDVQMPLMTGYEVK
jgi:CheY-like chemotaxis protein